MKITLLGTGTPILDLERHGSACLIQHNGSTLLFDAGRGVNSQLVRADVSPALIDAIFITHHHWDHIGDLGDVLIAAWHAGRSAPMHVYGPYGTEALVSALLDVVFKREIAMTMKLEARLGNLVDDIRNIVVAHDILPGMVTTMDDCDVYAAYVDHGNNLMPLEEWACVGYRLEVNANVIVLSGDTIICEGLEKLAQDADVLVQCCYLAEAEITSPEFEFLAAHVIASSGQLGAFAHQARVKKLVLTHFRKKSEAMMQTIIDNIRKDYAGDIILGSDLMEIDLVSPEASV